MFIRVGGFSGVETVVFFYDQAQGTDDEVAKKIFFFLQNSYNQVKNERPWAIKYNTSFFFAYHDP